jgi:hypothetical protein
MTDEPDRKESASEWLLRVAADAKRLNEESKRERGNWHRSRTI